MTGKPAVPLGGAMPVAAPSLATCGVPVALPRRAAGGAQWAVLDTGTHHFQHGPIDLIVRVDSPESLALEAAWQRFAVILPELVAELPLHLTRYHGCGLGEYLDDEQTLAVLVCRLNSLAQGYSGVR